MLGSIAHIKDAVSTAISTAGDVASGIGTAVVGAIEGAAKGAGYAIEFVGGAIVGGITGVLDILGSIFCFSHIIPEAIYNAIRPVNKAIDSLETVMVKGIASAVEQSNKIASQFMKNIETNKQLELGFKAYSEVLAPSLQRGGLIRETGLYSLEAGETVIPTGTALAAFEPTQIIVTIPSPTYYNSYYITVEARELSPAMTDMEKDELAKDISKRIQEEVERR